MIIGYERFPGYMTEYVEGFAQQTLKQQEIERYMLRAALKLLRKRNDRGLTPADFEEADADFKRFVSSVNDTPAVASTG